MFWLFSYKVTSGETGTDPTDGPHWIQKPYLLLIAPKKFE